MLSTSRDASLQGSASCRLDYCNRTLHRKTFFNPIDVCLNQFYMIVVCDMDDRPNRPKTMLSWDQCGQRKQRTRVCLPTCGCVLKQGDLPVRPPGRRKIDQSTHWARWSPYSNTHPCFRFFSSQLPLGPQRIGVNSSARRELHICGPVFICRRVAGCVFLALDV